MYITAFKYHDKYYDRLIVSRAWVIGCNGLFFYRSLYIAIKAKIKIDPSLRSQVTQVLYHLREWVGLFAELNIAVTILHRCAIQSKLPPNWKSTGYYDIHDMVSAQRRIELETPYDQMTPLFLLATERLIKLDERGYGNEHIQLAWRLGGFHTPYSLPAKLHELGRSTSGLFPITCPPSNQPTRDEKGRRENWLQMAVREAKKNLASTINGKSVSFLPAIQKLLT
ncbi:uncharacterized protein IL334_005397 [Kwoniella shivajii]|uniref:Uncharacterized protein n=1 Tax=Kwoniella shivajii TaxID=564305 RepID=A0ABZ1D638_9TREE|nr:hypothetical protein IL334_005397 [Kwoniella shivajii]